jgi:hypothetical protein
MKKSVLLSFSHDKGTTTQNPESTTTLNVESTKAGSFDPILFNFEVRRKKFVGMFICLSVYHSVTSHLESQLSVFHHMSSVRVGETVEF